MDTQVLEQFLLIITCVKDYKYKEIVKCLKSFALEYFSSSEEFCTSTLGGKKRGKLLSFGCRLGQVTLRPGCNFVVRENERIVSGVNFKRKLLD